MECNYIDFVKHVPAAVQNPKNFYTNTYICLLDRGKIEYCLAC